MTLRALKHFCTGPPVYGLNISADRYAASGIRFLRTTDVGNNGRLAAEGTGVYLSQDDVSRQYLLRDGDLLLSRSGTLGRSLLYREESIPTTHAGYLVRFRPATDTFPPYLGYCAQSRVMQDAVAADAIESTIGNFNAEKYANVRLPWWPTITQKAISVYLDRETAGIDAIITDKRRMADLLVERWHAALDHAVWTPGTPEISLRRVTRFIDYRGATPTKQDKGIPLVTASHIREGVVDHSLDPQFIGESQYKEWMRRGFPAVGDVLMTTEAPLGAVAQIDDPGVALAQRLILLKPTKVLLADFLALALRSKGFQARLQASATGSTALGIKADRLKGLEIPVPGIDIQAGIVATCEALDRMRAATSMALDRQVALLKERRQALITGVVTGQLDISEAA